MSAPLIEIDGVHKRFGEIIAVAGVSLGIRRGEIVGVIGHNGAGKSTLFKMVLGLAAPDAGAIRVAGVPVGGADFRAVRRRVGYLPENAVFYDNLSGLETLEFFAGLKRADPAACRPLLEKVGLGAVARRRVHGYSRGMRQRLGFAQALLGAPEVLILDEPTAGLDPEGIREFYAWLAELKAQGVTVVLSSHHLAEIEARVDRLVLMRLGRVQATGTVSELREALDLPLSLRLRLHDGAAEALRGALAPFARCAVRLNGAAAGVECARADKLPVLAALSVLPGVADIEVHEPSLEEVFLGYWEESRGRP